MASAFFEESLQILPLCASDQHSTAALGSFHLSVQESNTRSNYNVNLNCKGMIDGIESTTTVSAIVRKQDFVTVSFQQLEKIQTNLPNKKAEQVIKMTTEFGWEYESGKEKHAYLKRTSPNQTTWHTYTKEHLGYYVSEAACFLILRLFALGEIAWDFFGRKFSTFDKSGEISALEFYSISSTTSKSNGGIHISKRIVGLNGRSETWLYQYRRDGKLIQWKHKGTSLVFRALCAELEESLDPENESLQKHEALANKKGRKISFDDDRIKSISLDELYIDTVHQQTDSGTFDSYQDIKSQARHRCQIYLNKHPEIRQLFAELLRESMRSCPPDWLRFAAEFFKSKSSNNQR